MHIRIEFSHLPDRNQMLETRMSGDVDFYDDEVQTEPHSGVEFAMHQKL